MKRIKNLLFLLFASALFFACGVPKEVINRINNSPRELKEFPLTYKITLPTPTFEKWDSDYNSYNKYLTPEIMKTQLGMSFTRDSVRTWFCFPAVRTHTQLDTSTMIEDLQKVTGDWRVVSNRKIEFTDSAVYADKKIYRSNEIYYNEKEADVFLVMTDAKLKMYEADKLGGKYKLAISKNYAIINGRFLMVYNATKATGAMSQIGIDEEGHLILNSYAVKERSIKGQYINYESVVTQVIFKRQ